MVMLRQGQQIAMEVRVPLHLFWNAMKNLSSVAASLTPLLMSHTLVEGKSGGEGSVNLMQFNDGTYEKEWVEAVDDGVYTIVSTVFTGEGDDTDTHYKKTLQLKRGDNDSTTIAFWRGDYVPSVNGVSPLEYAREHALHLFRAVESSLGSLQDAYDSCSMQ